MGKRITSDEVPFLKDTHKTRLGEYHCVNGVIGLSDEFNFHAPNYDSRYVILIVS